MKLLEYINALPPADKIKFADRVASHMFKQRTSIVSLRNIAYGNKPRITGDMAVAIELASDGAVRMEELPTTFPVKKFLAFRSKNKRKAA